MIKSYRVLAAMALLALTSPASAALTRFDITGGTFADGTTFSGFFTIDTTTSARGDFNVVTNDGLLPAFTYDDANSGLYRGGGAGPNNFTIIKDDGRRVFNISFLSPLTEGTQAINIALSYDCNNCGTFRRVTGGSVSSVAAVPEPGTWAMMLLGYGGIGASMRRRRQVGDRSDGVTPSLLLLD